MKAIKVGVLYFFIFIISLLSCAFVSAIVGVVAYKMIGRPVTSMPQHIIPGQIIIVTGVTFLFLFLLLKKRASESRKRLISLWLAIVLPYVLVYTRHTVKIG